MIHLNVLAEQPELVKEHLRKRHAADSTLSDVDRIVDLHSSRKGLVHERDELRAARP